MAQYAYTLNNEVISIRNTKNTIPEFMWNKKGLLPYVLNIVRIPIEEPTDIIEGFEIKDNKIIETKIKRYKPLTPEELEDLYGGLR